MSEYIPAHQQRLIMGLDPGYRNLSVAFYDPNKNKMSMYNYDLHVLQGKTYKIERQHYRIIIPDLVRSFAEELKYVKAIFIEDQVVPDHKTKNPKVTKLVKEIAIIFEMTFTLFHPRIMVVMVHPSSVRACFKTHAKTYELRKLASEKRFFTYVSNADKEIICRALTKKSDSKFHVDPVEASLFAIYGYVHYDKYFQSMQWIRKGTSKKTQEGMWTCDCTLNRSFPQRLFKEGDQFEEDPEDDDNLSVYSESERKSTRKEPKTSNKKKDTTAVAAAASSSSAKSQETVHLTASKKRKIEPPKQEQQTSSKKKKVIVVLSSDNEEEEEEVYRHKQNATVIDLSK